MTIPDSDMYPQVIRYEGYFDFQGLLRHIVDWFQRYRFEVQETEFKHKIPSVSKGAEQEMSLKAFIRPTNYVEMEYSLKFHLWDITEVEVEEHHHKRMQAHGRIEIVINGKVKYDWQKLHQRSKFTQLLQKMYHKMKWFELGDWDDILFFRFLELGTHIRKYLGMETKYSGFKGILGDNR